ncbi:dynamin family protein [Lelliottia sp. SL45]|uniref:LeoA/HP0731 family dynamin-like GTPase n=2 Tax=Enterobacteriaceae TaxID=543 RepID=UPI002275A30C|nr:LeoA/HP0731 family dynamin-like GTPase [Lelliottia sp. SL45]MCY1697273.1 dynamin family protein [Lelliottia sp. SL45]
MEHTLDIFKSQKSKNIETLNNLKVFLQQGKELGIEIEPYLLHKLEIAQESAANGKLHIALIGGFSEGKTSIAAAWMEKLDKTTMNISHQESSSEVKIYNVGSDFVLIDTPGLFGFKEQFDEETRSVEKYKDMTKKYVSEAHLILYVMNSTNPIKESHKQDLEWMFRTLNLLDRTVFVLSRFDEVADVEDEEDYQSSYRVKRHNVVSRLHDLIDLTPQERDALSIVAVAANPFDMGTEYWLQNPEKFRTLSHIHTLQAATSQKIAAGGGLHALCEETKKSVILDILTCKLPVAIELDERIQEEVKGLLFIKERTSDEMSTMMVKIDEIRRSLKTFVSDYFSELILQAKGLSMETFLAFFEREVGDEGIVLSTRLQNEFDRRLQAVSLSLEKIQIGYNADINHHNSILTTLGKRGLDYVVKSNVINNSTVIATRDGAVSLAKMVGLDLGKLLKFKPWGAINLAKGLNGVLSFAGVALEVWDSFEQAQREKKFREYIGDMVEHFNKQRKELIALLDSDDYEERFFPGYAVMKEELEVLNDTLRRSHEQKKQFADWRAQAQAIDGEFIRVND